VVECPPGQKILGVRSTATQWNHCSAPWTRALSSTAPVRNSFQASTCRHS